MIIYTCLLSVKEVDIALSICSCASSRLFTTSVSAGDHVEHAQSADGEGDNADTDSTRANVAIDSVPGVELVAAAGFWNDEGFGRPE